MVPEIALRQYKDVSSFVDAGFESAEWKECLKQIVEGIHDALQTWEDEQKMKIEPSEQADSSPHLLTEVQVLADRVLHAYQGFIASHNDCISVLGLPTIRRAFPGGGEYIDPQLLADEWHPLTLGVVVALNNFNVAVNSMATYLLRARQDPVRFGVMDWEAVSAIVTEAGQQFGSIDFMGTTTDSLEALRSGHPDPSFGEIVGPATMPWINTFPHVLFALRVYWSWGEPDKQRWHQDDAPYSPAQP